MCTVSISLVGLSSGLGFFSSSWAWIPGLRPSGSVGRGLYTSFCPLLLSATPPPPPPPPSSSPPPTHTHNLLSWPTARVQRSGILRSQGKEQWSSQRWSCSDQRPGYQPPGREQCQLLCLSLWKEGRGGEGRGGEGRRGEGRRERRGEGRGGEGRRGEGRGGEERGGEGRGGEGGEGRGGEGREKRGVK